ncbi:MAG: tetratricopeptide repeat protein [Bryobacteraceae bacterium]
MDRLTRKELKSDRFALEVQHSVDYVSEHRRQLIRWVSIAAALAVVLVGVYLYREHQHALRQELLAKAFRIQNANVGQPGNEFIQSYSTNAEKMQAANKAFTELTVRYPGTEEGDIAQYFLATAAADKGDIQESERRFKVVADSGNAGYASLAKLSLAQIYNSQGKEAEGEKLIRSVIDKPTVFVSKEEATIALARLMGPAKPQEARKLLEPLRASERSAVSRAALTALSDIQPK